MPAQQARLLAVVLETTFHSWAIWSLLSGHGTRVVVANSMQVKAIARARVKTDKIDAYILAQLLRADFIPEVEMPGEETWELRQLMTHRQLLARHRTAARNAVCGILNRKLLMTIPGINVTVVGLARKLVVVVWHLLTHQEPYRYAPTRRTRVKLRRVTPGLPAAKTGCIPNTLETIHAEIGQPDPRAATTGEKRAAADNPLCVTRHRKAQAKESIGV
jgi:hypothetical protein